MTQEQIIQLTKIYNTLALIQTSGENTIIMGDCLKATRDFINELNKQMEENAVEEVKE